MSGYQNSGYGYGAPPPTAQPYNPGAPPPTAQPYNPGAPPPTAQPYNPGSAPYGAPPSQHSHQSHQSYGSGASPYGGPSAPYAPPGEHKPPKDNAHMAGAPPPPNSSSGYPTPSSGYQTSSSGYPPSAPPYGNNLFASLVPSAFPPGTDPSIVACFKMADQDGSGFIDDKELQRALSSYNENFSIRTVHLLMYLFTNSNARKIGPKEFTAVFYSLQNWRVIFERFDRDRSGKIDPSELREALMSLGFAVSPMVLDLLVSKFDKTGGRNKAIEYDNFIECCLTVKGLTEKFKEKDTTYSGSATFNYETFMLTVLPFLIA